MCEGIATIVENITAGKVFLRILSNLTDRALVYAQCVIPTEYLGDNAHDGEQVRDGIIVANDFAAVDPYRAATHNKGIMNGVDAMALATGNDWRALEAAAHAYAARGHRYTSLTRWYKNPAGDLVGEIEMPMKVGTVGGPLQSNPTVAMNQRLLGVRSARELAELMGAVGLAQNFSALRALVTEGIQQGHMTLHARSVAIAAGATPEIFDAVVERLIESGDIKIWKAQQIIDTVRVQALPDLNDQAAHAEQNGSEYGAGYGKVILLGEHAVVYGRQAIAAPIPLAIRSKIKDAKKGVTLIIPRWGIEQRIHEKADHPDSFQNNMIGIIIGKLGLDRRPMRIEVFPNVPRAMGLGGSAAMAVAIIRAMDVHYRLGLSDEAVNSLVFECEKVAHGTPSGIDNTVATYGKFLLFRAGTPPDVRDLQVRKPIPMVIGLSGVESLTAKMVARVQHSWERNKVLYEHIFDEMELLVLQGLEAIAAYDLERLGVLMNVCQGYLTALQVSSAEIEELVQIARDNGALGAKLTGGGGGGSVIALCPDNACQVIKAMQDAGYQGMEVNIG